MLFRSAGALQISEIALIDIQEAQRLKKQIKQQKSITTNVTSLEKLNDDI